MKNYLHFLPSYLRFLSNLLAEKPGWDVAARQPLPAVSERHRMTECISKHFIPFGNQIQMLMKPIARFLLLLLLLSQAACKKDKSPDPGPLYIPQEVKDYVLFQPGTYWVYIDSVSGRVDSVYVYETNHSLAKLTIGNHPEREYEIFVVKAHSAMDDYDYYFEVNTTYSANNETLFDVFEEKMKPGKYVGKTIVFIYKPFVGQKFYEGPATKTIEAIYSDFKMGSFFYHDVIRIFQDISYIEVSNNATIYTAKNFGIIRKELADSNQVWVLARSKIIQ